MPENQPYTRAQLIEAAKPDSHTPGRYTMEHYLVVLRIYHLSRYQQLLLAKYIDNVK